MSAAFLGVNPQVNEKILDGCTPGFAGPVEPVPQQNCDDDRTGYFVLVTQSIIKPSRRNRRDRRVHCNAS